MVVLQQVYLQVQLLLAELVEQVVDLQMIQEQQELLIEVVEEVVLAVIQQLPLVVQVDLV